MAALDFPNAPTVGQKYPQPALAGVPVYTWDGEKWTTTGSPPITDGVVHYDTAQALTAPQQTQARTNIDANSNVRFDTQALIASQATQARKNIFAAPIDALSLNGLQINGTMRRDERRMTGVEMISGQFPSDCWRFASSATPVKAYRGASSNPGLPVFIYTYPTGAFTIATNDYATLYQAVEGIRTEQLGWGKANPQPLTVSFWSAKSKAGVYSVSVCNADVTRCCVMTYNHIAGNVDQYVSLTFPGCPDGTWKTDNGPGLYVQFVSMSGLALMAPASGVWYNQSYMGGPGMTPDGSQMLCGINGVTFFAGSEAPPAARAVFLNRTYEQETPLCQRHYSEMPLYGIGMRRTTAMLAGTLTVPLGWEVPMRVVPTLAGISYGVMRGDVEYPIGMVNNASNASYYAANTSDLTEVGGFIGIAAPLGVSTFDKVPFHIQACLIRDASMA